MDIILILTPDSLLKTVQMWSRYGWLYDTYFRFSCRNSSDTIQMRMTFWYLFHILSNTVQIRMSFWHSFNTPFKYSLDTIQIRMTFWRSFSTSFRYESDTIHLWILFWYSSHYIYCFSVNQPEIYSDTSSNFCQQSLLGGIYKPTSNNSPSSL